MLLSSERHSPEDLALWEMLERGDMLTGKRLARSPRSARAVSMLKRFVDEGPCYLGTSWGKDSVVVCHMAASAGVRVPIVHIVQEGPQRDPEQHRVRDVFLARFDVDYHEVVVEEQTREQRETGRAPALEVGIRRAQARWGKRWISGLRAEESGVRKLRAKIGSDASCWPIAWWTAREVYGWLAYHLLPVHPAYAMTQGGMWDRDWIRVSILGGEKGQQHGRREWERHYYPREMARIEHGDDA